MLHFIEIAGNAEILLTAIAHSRLGILATQAKFLPSGG